jgi:hypothetical protein
MRLERQDDVAVLRMNDGRANAEAAVDAARWTATWLSPDGHARLRAAVARLQK